MNTEKNGIPALQEGTTKYTIYVSIVSPSKEPISRANLFLSAKHPIKGMLRDGLKEPNQPPPINHRRIG